MLGKRGGMNMAEDAIIDERGPRASGSSCLLGYGTM